MKAIGLVGSSFCAAFVASAAWAQTAVTATVATASVAAEMPGAPRSPPPAPKAVVVAKTAEVVTTAEPPDHVAMVGRVGVGFAGARDLAVGTLQNTLPAPTIAARMWLSERLALELGLGLGHSSGTVSVLQPGSTTTVRDSATQWGVALQAGVPIAMTWGEHYAFVVTPEMRLGIAWITPGGDPERAETDDGATGTTFELGGRAGAEVHFGFIGVPELALEASIGLFMRYVDVGTTDGANETGASSVSVATISYNDPWDFFRTSVAARYYF